MRYARLLHRVLVAFVVVAAPLSIGYWLWLGDPEPGQLSPRFGGSAVMDLVSVLWVVALLYTGVAFAVARRFRAGVVVRLSGLRERDEREIVVTGQAARSAFLVSSALLLGALLLSVFSVSFKTGGTELGSLQISLGARFELADYVEIADTPDGGTKVNVDFLPQSMAPLVLAFLAVNLITFRYQTRALRAPEPEETA
jgi:hypothetical protein